MSGLLAGFIAANAASPLRANTKSEEINRSKANSNVPKTIAIIGAGVAGLTAAYRAAQGGHRVCVFETADRKSVV